MWYIKFLAKLFISIYLITLIIILVAGLPYSIYINKLDDYLKTVAPFSTAIAGVIAMYQWKKNQDYKNKFRENIMMRRIEAYEKIMDLLASIDIYVSTDDIQTYYFFVNENNRKDIAKKIVRAKAASMWLDKDIIKILDIYNKAIFSAFQYISRDDEVSLKLYLQLLCKEKIDDNAVEKVENKIYELSLKRKYNITGCSNHDIARGIVMTPYLISYIKETRRRLLLSLSKAHQIDVFLNQEKEMRQ